MNRSTGNNLFCVVHNKYFLRNVIVAQLIAMPFITITAKVTYATLPIPFIGISTAPIPIITVLITS